jgi:hypothetical protein
MTDIEQDPPHLAIYNKDLRMYRAGISKYEFARLDADNTLFVKVNEVDEDGMFQHSNSTIYPEDSIYERIRQQHNLNNPGDSSVFEKRLVDGNWIALSKPTRYRWAMLTDDGTLLVKIDPDSDQTISRADAQYQALCHEHKLQKPGDHSVVELP